ncbi:MAG: hypothetical protein IJZ54_05015 [Clostridia bacterium]|nr:hypothetical protein [Clostridia bacterium]
MKQFISVTARFDPDGNLLPLKIHWSDGRSFEIQKVMDVKYATSQKEGGVGLRYTCRIAGNQRYLFFDEKRWFVDSKA